MRKSSGFAFPRKPVSGKCDKRTLLGAYSGVSFRRADRAPYFVPERAGYSLTAKFSAACSMAFWSAAVISSSPSRITTFAIVPVNLKGTW